MSSEILLYEKYVNCLKSNLADRIHVYGDFKVEYSVVLINNIYVLCQKTDLKVLNTVSDTKCKFCNLYNAPTLIMSEKD